VPELRPFTLWRFISPAGPSLVVLSAHLETWLRQMRCPTGGFSTVTENRVAGAGEGPSGS
jgi:hypothetical protein